MYFTERKATGNVILYVQFTTLFLTFHLGLDLRNFLFLSGFQTEFLCVFLTSLVNFSFPICPTVFQFTTHHHSTPSTNHATPHCAISFIFLLLASLQNKYLLQSLFQHSISLFILWNTNTHHRTQFCVPETGFFFHKYNPLC